jgi:hypothetical protein
MIILLVHLQTVSANCITINHLFPDNLKRSITKGRWSQSRLYNVPLGCARLKTVIQLNTAALSSLGNNFMFIINQHIFYFILFYCNHYLQQHDSHVNTQFTLFWKALVLKCSQALRSYEMYRISFTVLIQLCKQSDIHIKMTLLQS